MVGWGSAPPGKPPPSSPCVTPAGMGSFTETLCGEGKPRHGGTRAPAGRGGSLQGAAPSRKEKGVKKHPTDAFATIPQPHGLVPISPPFFPLWFWGKKIKIAFSGFFSPTRLFAGTGQPAPLVLSKIKIPNSSRGWEKGGPSREMHANACKILKNLKTALKTKNKSFPPPQLYVPNPNRCWQLPDDTVVEKEHKSFIQIKLSFMKIP